MCHFHLFIWGCVVRVVAFYVAVRHWLWGGRGGLVVCKSARFVVRKVELHVVLPGGKGLMTVYCVSCGRVDHRQFCSVAGAAL